LDSKRVLLLDHGTDIFTWIGMEVTPDVEAVALTARDSLIAKLSAYRFPTPRVLTFREATSASRYMMSRLAPLHKDAAVDQDISYPPLALLQPQERQALVSKFLFTDDPSFNEWMLSLPVLPTRPDSYSMFMAKSADVAAQSATTTTTSAAAAAAADLTERMENVQL